MKKKIAKALVINSENKILCLYRSETHPRFPLHLDFPGGEVDGLESESEAIAREIDEETSININYKHLQKMFIKSYSTVDHVLYSIKINESQPLINLSWEHIKYQWFSKSELLQQNIPSNADAYFLDVINYIKSSHFKI
jgi:8-oxo-dGTP pyrophosphatase MutT (NUDIX family)